MNTQQIIRDLQAMAKELKTQPDRNGKLETAVTNIYCAAAMVQDYQATQPATPDHDFSIVAELGIGYLFD